MLLSFLLFEPSAFILTVNSKQAAYFAIIRVRVCNELSFNPRLSRKLGIQINSTVVRRANAHYAVRTRIGCGLI